MSTTAHKIPGEIWREAPYSSTKTTKTGSHLGCTPSTTFCDRMRDIVQTAKSNGSDTKAPDPPSRTHPSTAHFRVAKQQNNKRIQDNFVWDDESPSLEEVEALERLALKHKKRKQENTDTDTTSSAQPRNLFETTPPTAVNLQFDAEFEKYQQPKFHDRRSIAQNISRMTDGEHERRACTGKEEVSPSQYPSERIQQKGHAIFFKGQKTDDVRSQVQTQLHPLNLNQYLPQYMCDAMTMAGGPRKLYDWQAECLCRPGVLSGKKNLVYCAPTSGGKSLVAEIIMLNRIIDSGKPALLVLPFISICDEKSAQLKNTVEAMGREVCQYYGLMSPSSPIGPTTGVIVATIEKANMLVNKMLHDGEMDVLSSVVIDELHMVGDEERGYQLELLLTKLRYTSRVGRRSTSDHKIQIVGMSATLPNVSEVSQWLDADLYVSTHRPIPLRQYIKIGNEIRNEQGALVRCLQPPSARDMDHVAFLTHENVSAGHATLIFCATRAACEKNAAFLAETLPAFVEREVGGKVAIQPSNSDKMASLQLFQWPPTRQDIVQALQNYQKSTKGEATKPPGTTHDSSINNSSSMGGESQQVTWDLATLVSKGVAYHHAGLDPEQRELIELGYKFGAISVLCATSTLAAGVNLPARRVILRHPYVGRQDNILEPIKYRQMIGRAGRAGIDAEGESYLIAVKNSPVARLQALMQAEPAPIVSGLREEARGMKRAMLEVVACGAVRSPSDVQEYIQCTLLAAICQFDTVAKATTEALKWLGDKDRSFIFWDKESSTFQPTNFGLAAINSGLPPEQCIHIKTDINRARASFVLTTELHLAYLCVPATEDIIPDYTRLWHIYHSLGPSEQSVAQKIGLDIGYIRKRLEGHGYRSATNEEERICRRFWAALILTDVIQEMEPDDIYAKYGMVRGDIHGLRERACRYAGMIALFVERLGYHEIELLVTKFQTRVLHGVRPEMLSLMEIPGVAAYTARLLWKAGLRSPEAVASVPSSDKIASCLVTTGGSSRGGRYPDKRRIAIQAARILKSARDLLYKRALNLKKEAQTALELAQKS